MHAGCCEPPFAAAWVSQGFVAEVHLSPEFLQRFRETLRGYPLVRKFRTEDALSLMRRTLSASDRARIMAHIRTPSADGGALILRCDGQLNADELTALLLALGASLGPPLPELGMGGALWHRLVIAPPPGGVPPGASRAFHHNPSIAFPLHTDGAYHSPRPGWVALGKVGEWAAEGGDTLLLHGAQWEGAAEFLARSWAFEQILWETPGAVPPEEIQLLRAVGVETNVTAPLFEPADGGLRVRLGTLSTFIVEGFQRRGQHRVLERLLEVEASVMHSRFARPIRLERGDAYLLNNLTVLHGREPFAPNPVLRRVVVRARGHFEA